ncbi:MAG: AIPR family protein [Candidatus Thiodiazotropha sp. (ex Lucinoma borealis)]|nr:AIPR family protein [Candidatus Thiodiazotropha sp. (ex Lucinoma borealis)]
MSVHEDSTWILRAASLRLKKRRYEKEYPKPKSFTKTDLAKFLNVWERIPHIVSTGAQKNFATFAADIGKKWEKSSNQFNELFFKHTISKAIIFRKLEKLVMQQPWYRGGYRANIVAYTISKLADMLISSNKILDFESIWKAQGISPALRGTLVYISETVHGVITDPPVGTSNVTEWAKKQACWSRVQQLQLTMPNALKAELLTTNEQKAKQVESKKVRKIDNGIEAQKKALELGAKFWKQSLEWDSVHQVLSEKDRQIMGVAALIPRKLPSEKQSLYLMDVLEILQEEACPHAQNI